MNGASFENSYCDDGGDEEGDKDCGLNEKGTECVGGLCLRLTRKGAMWSVVRDLWGHDSLHDLY